MTLKVDMNRRCCYFNTICRIPIEHLTTKSTPRELCLLYIRCDLGLCLRVVKEDVYLDDNFMLHSQFEPNKSDPMFLSLKNQRWKAAFTSRTKATCSNYLLARLGNRKHHSSTGVGQSCPNSFLAAFVQCHGFYL